MRTNTNPSQTLLAGSATKLPSVSDWPTSSELMDRVKIGTLSHAMDSRIDRRFALMEEYPQNCLWIVAHADALRAFKDPHPVRLSFVDEAWRRELVVSGDLQLMDDRELLKDLWDDAAQRCFPRGPGSPSVALAQFNLKSARDTVVSDAQRLQRMPVSNYVQRIAQLGGWGHRLVPAASTSPQAF